MNRVDSTFLGYSVLARPEKQNRLKAISICPGVLTFHCQFSPQCCRLGFSPQCKMFRHCWLLTNQDLESSSVQIGAL